MNVDIFYVKEMWETMAIMNIKIQVPTGIQSNNKPLPEMHSAKKVSKRIGIAEGEELYAPDYDIDEYNEKIAKLFGMV